MQKNSIVSVVGIIIIFAIAGGVISVIFSGFINLNITQEGATTPQKTVAAIQPPGSQEETKKKTPPHSIPHPLNQRRRI